jgi:5'-3' exonuclease
MGIKNLSQFLKKHKVYDTLNISKLKYTKIAIDTPMFLYKFKSMYPDEWLSSFINLIAFLRKVDIHPIFVFEGKAPPEKSQTQAIRREQKQKLVDKTNQMQTSLDNFIKNGEKSPLLLEVWSKLNQTGGLLVKKTFINTEQIQDEINRRRKYEFTITTEDIESVKELFDLCGIKFIQSSGEAETECISLFYSGLVDYIVSEDTDVLAYHTPQMKNINLKVITSFNTNELTFVQISKNKVLRTLNLSSESFRDFCIMCGTDYNKNIFRVGVEKAYKFILECKTIENVPLDTSILNHKKVRSLFEVKFNHDLTELNYCKIPDKTFIDKLALFGFNNSLKHFDVNYTFKALSEPSFTLLIET